MTLDPVQVAENWDRTARGYNEFAVNMTRKFALDALELLRVSSDDEFLDVAAGTGAVSLEAAARGARVVATDFSRGMLEMLDENAANRGLEGIRTEVMDGQNLELEDETFDAAASVFGLMMFPDRAAGFGELHRVLRSGGRAAVGVWGSPERLQFFSAMSAAVAKGLPDLPQRREPPGWLALCEAANLVREMTEAGFVDVRAFTVAHFWDFGTPELLWERLPNLSAGSLQIFDHITEEQRARFGEAFRSTLVDICGRGPWVLTGEAHIAVGYKA